MKAEFRTLLCGTCEGVPRRFRQLKAHEKAYLRSQNMIEADVHRAWRCDTEGCRSYRLSWQPWTPQQVFPESIDD
jgi:hypothetical protein